MPATPGPDAHGLGPGEQLPRDPGRHPPRRVARHPRDRGRAGLPAAGRPAARARSRMLRRHATEPHPSRPVALGGPRVRARVPRLAALVVRRGGLAFDEPLAAALQALPIPVGFWEACTFLGGAVLVPIGVAFVLAAGALPPHPPGADHRRRAHRRRAVHGAREGLRGPAAADDGPARRGVRLQLPVGPHPQQHRDVRAPGARRLAQRADARRSAGPRSSWAWWSPSSSGSRGSRSASTGPTDVLAGWLAGVAFVALAATLIRLTGAMERDLPRRAAGRARRPARRSGAEP